MSAVLCKGKTKAGSECKNKTKNESGYCFRHSSQMSSPSNSSAITKPCIIAKLSSTSTKSKDVNTCKAINEIPQVINIRAKELRNNGYQNINEWLEASENHMYIGRQMRIKSTNKDGIAEWCYLKKSKFHNPFKGDRNKVCESFEKYARKPLTKVS